jgi:putative endonuclease
LASLYILHSNSVNKFYIGATKDLFARIDLHSKKEFKNSFTAKYEDWEIFFSIDNISISTAYKIEAHIKKMKSKTFIHNLKLYPELVAKLINQYDK